MKMKKKFDPIKLQYVKVPTFDDEVNEAEEVKEFKGKYGTYEELSKLYEDSHANYLALSEILNTTVGKLAYQNMMLEKAREAYKYIIEGDNE